MMLNFRFGELLSDIVQDAEDVLKWVKEELGKEPKLVTPMEKKDPGTQTEDQAHIASQFISPFSLSLSTSIDVTNVMEERQQFSRNTVWKDSEILCHKFPQICRGDDCLYCRSSTHSLTGD